MSIPLYQVDAFTSDPFAGNPAAVCILPAERPESWMQAVASEMNLSETAFLRPLDNGSYRLRWFTPTQEVDLCGHATLASAHVLWSEGHLARSAEARFETRSGTLSADWEKGWIRMDFPTDSLRSTETPPELFNGLGDVRPAEVLRTDRDFLVRLETAEQVHSLAPDLDAFSQIGEGRGVIVTAPATQNGVDFVSRYFAPTYGIPEDPVTGSTHCALGPYWAEKLDKTSLMARQVSARGGTVRIHMEAPDASRILLGGQATTVLRGRFDDAPLTSPDAE